MEGLRNFLARYGDGDAVGLEARFLLAQRLSEEGQAGYFLEAESHLLRLARRKDSPAIAGRAVEALTHLMLRQGLLEDAAPHGNGAGACECSRTNYEEHRPF